MKLRYILTAAGLVLAGCSGNRPATKQDVREAVEEVIATATSGPVCNLDNYDQEWVRNGWLVCQGDEPVITPKGREALNMPRP